MGDSDSQASVTPFRISHRCHGLPVSTERPGLQFGIEWISDEARPHQSSSGSAILCRGGRVLGPTLDRALYYGRLDGVLGFSSGKVTWHVRSTGDIL